MLAIPSRSSKWNGSMNEQVMHVTVSVSIPNASLLNQDNHPGKSIHTQIIDSWGPNVNKTKRTHPIPTEQKVIVYEGNFCNTKFQVKKIPLAQMIHHVWRMPSHAMRQDSCYCCCWSASDAWAFASVSFDGKLVRVSQIFSLGCELRMVKISEKSEAHDIWLETRACNARSC